MPYISRRTRFKFESALDQLMLDGINTKGELEYILFAILVRYMKNRKFCYSELHDTVYACQHVADEFRRRFLDKRENEARHKNGDIE